MKIRTLLAGLLLIMILPLSGQVIWTPVPFPATGEEISTLGLDATGNLFVGTMENVYYSNDGGTNWFQCTNWPPFTPLCIDFNSLNYVYIGTNAGGVFRSTDGGATFTDIGTGLPVESIWTIMILNNDDILVGTPEGIFRSDDEGANWTLVIGGNLPIDDIRALTDGGNGRLFAGTDDHGVFRSYDNGVTWTDVNFGLPGPTLVTALLAIPDTTIVFAGIYPQGMYKSSDDGNSWEEDNLGLPFMKSYPKYDYSIDAILYFLNYFGLEYIFTVIGYYGIVMQQLGFDDGGWTPVNDGLPGEPHVSCIVANQESFYLGAKDQGLYQNAYPVALPGKVPAAETMSMSCYPNPARDNCNLSFFLPASANLRIIVTNSLGSESLTLGETFYLRGNHIIDLKGNGLSPGIYHVTLSTKTSRVTQKVVIE